MIQSSCDAQTSVTSNTTDTNDEGCVNKQSDDSLKDTFKSSNESCLAKEMKIKTITEHTNDISSCISKNNYNKSERIRVIKITKLDNFVKNTEAHEESERKDITKEYADSKVQSIKSTESIKTDTTLKTTNTQSSNLSRSIVQRGVSELKLKIDLREKIASEHRRPVVAIIPVQCGVTKTSTLQCGLVKSCAEEASKGKEVGKEEKKAHKKSKTIKVFLIFNLYF